MQASPHKPAMSSAAEENRMAMDVFAWFSNVATSVLIVFVNKVLMDPHRGYAFVFATTLCSFHFFASAGFVKTTEALGFGKPAKLPWKDTLFFSFVAGISIASLNLSLLVNSVGFYQISKLLIIPFVCFIEFVWLKRRFSFAVLMSIATVVVGVGIVTVTDMNVNFGGLVIALVSVITSGMQQILCGTVQRKHNLTSNQLLSNTAPVQGLMLLVTGPFIDLLLSGQWLFSYQPTPPAMRCLFASCLVAVFVNISQFMCLGRFSAVTFQVLGHTKTILVLLVGVLYLNDHINERKFVGMAVAIMGMVGYGYFSSKQQKSSATGSSKKEPPVDQTGSDMKKLEAGEARGTSMQGRGYAS